MRYVPETTLWDMFVFGISLMELQYNLQDSFPAGKLCLNSGKQIHFLNAPVLLHLVA